MSFWSSKKNVPEAESTLPEYVPKDNPSVPTATQTENAEVEQEEEALFPSATIPIVSVSKEELTEYEELANSIDFSPSELTRLRLLTFFAERKIALFDNKKVTAWLTAEREDADDEELWTWRALRQSDVSAEYSWGNDDNEWQDGYYTSTDEENAYYCRPYDRLVPIPILKLVKEIEEVIGSDKINFYVSDYDDEESTTFIMVRPSVDDSGYGEFNLIFGSWDNPVDMD